MLEILVASGPRDAGAHGWSARACSLFVHCAVIGAAIALSQRPPAGPLDRPVAVPVFFPPPPHPANPVEALPAAPAPGPVSIPLHLPTILQIGTVIQPIEDPVGAVRLPGADSTPGLSQIGTPGTPGPLVIGAAPLDARYVDEPPEVISHPEPRYPEVLRQAGLEGRVVVEAVLDTTGRAEPGSLRVISTAHELFGNEARQVVLASRFRPGRVAGRAVRVRIQIPVVFSIRR